MIFLKKSNQNDEKIRAKGHEFLHSTGNAWLKSSNCRFCEISLFGKTTEKLSAENHKIFSIFPYNDLQSDPNQILPEGSGRVRVEFFNKMSCLRSLNFRMKLSKIFFKICIFSWKISIFSQKSHFFLEKPQIFLKKPRIFLKNLIFFSKNFKFVLKHLNFFSKISLFSRKISNFSQKITDLSYKISIFSRKTSNLSLKISKYLNFFLKNLQNLLEKS